LYLVNAKEFLREKMAWILVLLLPVVLASFFGLLFDGGDRSWTLQVGVVNQDTGPAGAQFVEGLAAPVEEGAFGLHIGTQAEMVEALERGDLHVVLVLPEGMSAALAQGQPVVAEVFYDPAQSASADAGLSLVRNLLSEANLAFSGVPSLLAMEAQSVQTNSLRMIDIQMPGMLGIALLWLGLFGTALPLLQQRTGQVLRRLSVTPLRPATMLAAQVGWRVTVGLLQAGLFLLVGYFAFGVGIQGNKLLFVGAVALGALVFVSLGYMLAGLSSSEEALMAVTQAVNFPMMFLSGSLFPVETLPVFFKPVVNVLPLTYLADALGQLMVGASPLHPLWLDFAVLGGWLVLFVVLGIKFWRWE
jgi:ABC-2 type transport system permease protein